MRVVLFAALRDLAGADRVDVDPAPGDVAELLERLAADYGDRFARIAGAGSVVVNGETAGPDRRLEATDEVAVLPPVSGG